MSAPAGWIPTVLVEPTNETLGGFRLQGFAIDRVVGVSAALEVLSATAHECVLVAWAPGVVESMLSPLRARCDELGLAMLLVASPSTEQVLVDLVASELFDGYLDPGWPPEVAAPAAWSMLRRSLVAHNLAEAQRVVISAAQSTAHSLQSLVFRDDLTCLNNLRYFREVLSKEHARCERHRHSYSIVFLDLDGLREVNTHYGHAAGGHVLAMVGEVIASHTRTCDYSFRIGGDEFVTLMVDTGRDGARVFSERLCGAIRSKPIPYGDAKLHISASAGVAAYPDDGASSQLILERADQAVYRAKAAGKDQVVCFS